MQSLRFFGLYGSDVPRRSTPGSAGYDCILPSDQRVVRGQRRIIPLGFRVQFPPGHFGMLVVSPALVRNGWTLHGGVIDGDYDGEICAVMSYDGVQPYAELNSVARVAQLLILPCYSEQ